MLRFVALIGSLAAGLMIFRGNTSAETTSDETTEKLDEDIGCDTLRKSGLGIITHDPLYD